ncbi:MAG: glycosyltransferase family 39 protein [Pleurocapsa minor GSE-CHR-MK-17-07R]|jgi:4-amino-4-deoxy-L-arabinose transferase-like glycosyltransferase|nr:glycosyltransferase family 39 protein [Pleurocapsa minor GSE-CHR-MK 17-07R]
MGFKAQRSSAIIFRVCVGAAAIILALFFLVRPAVVVTDVRGAATVRFEAPTDLVIFTSDCLEISWQVEGIRELYLNGQGVVGVGAQIVCRFDAPPSLRVVFLDGSEAIYTLPVRIAVLHPVVWALALLITGCLVTPALSRDVHGLLAPAIRILDPLLRSPLFYIGLITLLGAALRLHTLGTRWMVLDEVVLYDISSAGSLSTVLESNAIRNSAPPLYALMVTATTGLGNAEIIARMWSFVAGMLFIPAMYRLAREYVSQTGAIFAALVAAVSLSATFFSQYVREYSWSMLLCALLLLAASRWLRTGARASGLALIVLGGIAIFMQYGLALVLGSISLIMLIRCLIHRSDRRLWAFTGTAFAVWAACAVSVYFLSFRIQMQPGGFASDSYLAGGYWNQDVHTLIPFLLNGTVNIFQSSLGSGIFGRTWDIGVFVIPAFFGALAVLTVRLRWEWRALLVLPFVLTAVAGVLDLYPYIPNRQTAFLAVPVMLCCGFAFHYGLAAIREVRLRRAALICVLVLVSTATWQTYTAYYRHEGFDNVRGAISTLRSMRGFGEPIVVLDYAIWLFLHYAPDEASSTEVFLAGNTPETYTQITDLLTQSPVVWVLLANGEEAVRAAAVTNGWTLDERTRLNNVVLFAVSNGS